MTCRRQAGPAIPGETRQSGDGWGLRLPQCEPIGVRRGFGSLSRRREGARNATNLPESPRRASENDSHDLQNSRLRCRRRRRNAAISSEIDAIHSETALRNVKSSPRQSRAPRRNAAFLPEIDALRSEIALQNLKNSRPQRPTFPKVRALCDWCAGSEGASVAQISPTSAQKPCVSVRKVRKVGRWPGFRLYPQPPHSGVIRFFLFLFLNEASGSRKIKRKIHTTLAEDARPCYPYLAA
jgi:hypothetical protein